MMLSKFAAHSDKVHRLLQVLRQIHSFSLSSAPGGHVWHLSVVGWAVSYRFKLTFCPSLPSYSFVSEWCAHDQKLHLNWTFIFYILCAIRGFCFFYTCIKIVDFYLWCHDSSAVGLMETECHVMTELETVCLTLAIWMKAICLPHTFPKKRAKESWRNCAVGRDRQNLKETMQ